MIAYIQIPNMQMIEMQKWDIIYSLNIEFYCVHIRYVRLAKAVMNDNEY